MTTRKWLQTHTREAMAAAGALVLVLVLAIGFGVSRHRASSRHPAVVARAVQKAVPASSPTPRAHAAAPVPHVVLASAQVNPASQEYMRAGYSFYGKKDYLEAANAFREAGKQDAKNADARWWLAKSYTHAGKDSKACTAYGEYLELAPAGAHAHDAKTALKKCS